MLNAVDPEDEFAMIQDELEDAEEQRNLQPEHEEEEEAEVRSFTAGTKVWGFT